MILVVQIHGQNHGRNRDQIHDHIHGPTHDHIHRKSDDAMNESAIEWILCPSDPDQSTRLHWKAWRWRGLRGSGGAIDLILNLLLCVSCVCNRLNFKPTFMC